jgi:molecular chaperone GrpE (heat shock protein)
MSEDKKEGFVVRDRRFWVDADAPVSTEEGDAAEASSPETPTDPEPAPSVERLRLALAELEDTKLRVRRDGEKQLDHLRGRVLEALFPVLDNLDRCIAAADDQDGSLLEGVKLVRTQFLGALAPFGLERISAVGARFDPRLHDAIAVVPVEDTAQDGVVVAEMEPAYCVGERVIRPAKVQVGRAADRPPA